MNFKYNNLITIKLEYLKLVKYKLLILSLFFIIIQAVVFSFLTKEKTAKYLGIVNFGQLKTDDYFLLKSLLKTNIRLKSIVDISFDKISTDFGTQKILLGFKGEKGSVSDYEIKIFKERLEFVHQQLTLQRYVFQRFQDFKDILQMLEIKQYYLNQEKKVVENCCTDSGADFYASITNFDVSSILKDEDFYFFLKVPSSYKIGLNNLGDYFIEKINEVYQENAIKIAKIRELYFKLTEFRSIILNIGLVDVKKIENFHINNNSDLSIAANEIYKELNHFQIIEDFKLDNIEKIKYNWPHIIVTILLVSILTSFLLLVTFDRLRPKDKLAYA